MTFAKGFDSTTPRYARHAPDTISRSCFGTTVPTYPPIPPLLGRPNLISCSNATRREETRPFALLALRPDGSLSVAPNNATMITRYVVGSGDSSRERCPPSILMRETTHPPSRDFSADFRRSLDLSVSWELRESLPLVQVMNRVSFVVHRADYVPPTTLVATAARH